ncbi:MAG: ABC transporter ATP-binding protein [Patescibacteria group bacterium]
MLALSVENLKKIYREVEAVKGVSFSVAEKEIFALIGPNGAGKSTTLKMLATILTPTSGKAEIYGFDVTKQANEVRKIISYLPEEAGAYKNLSGKDYLQFMAAIYTDDTKKQKEFMELGTQIADLKNRLKDKIKTYSKGMTRKLLLARTVMNRPKLAILDEPTSGLDIVNGLEIRKTIRQMAGQGMSVLLSSHNMLEIEFLSDRVGIIAQGQLMEIGTPSELKAKYGAANLEEVFMKLSHA